MDEAQFRKYIDAFNTGDFERCYAEFWTPDVTLKGAAFELRGRDFVNYMSNLRKTVIENITITASAFSEGQIMAEADIKFSAIADNSDLFLGSISAGEIFKVKYMVCYVLKGRRISAVRTYRWPTGAGFDQKSV